MPRDHRTFHGREQQYGSKSHREYHDQYYDYSYSGSSSMGQNEGRNYQKGGYERGYHGRQYSMQEQRRDIQSTSEEKITDVQVLNELVVMIRRMCYLLELTHITTCTSLHYFHTYCTTFLASEAYDLTIIACACVFLACKTEEQVRRARDVINCMKKVLNPNSEPLRLVDDEIHDLKDCVIGYEGVITRCIKFKFVVIHPFKYILAYCSSLQDYKGITITKQFVELCFNLAHKSYDIPCCVEYQPHEIAAAMVYLSAEILQITELTSFPKEETTEGERQWFHVFNVEERKLLEIVSKVKSILK